MTRKERKKQRQTKAIAESPKSNLEQTLPSKKSCDQTGVSHEKIYRELIEGINGEEGARDRRRTNRINIALAIGTFLAVFVAAWQVNVTKESIVATQSQFEITNRPFLNLRAFDINFKEGQEIAFGVSITNHGNYIARIEGAKFAWRIMSETPDYRAILDTIKSPPVKFYVTKDFPYETIYKEPKPFIILPDTFKAVVEKQADIYVFGQIDYFDESNENQFVYVFAFKLLEPEKWQIHPDYRMKKFIENKNYPVKK